MNTIRFLVHPSPLGPLRLAATDAGLVAIHLPAQRHMPADIDPAWQPAAPDDAATWAILGAAGAQLDDYFAGTRLAFDLPIAAGGTAFQRDVWAALEAIPFGCAISYGELARRIGRPKAMRAVGLANGRNPVCIVVPCHRVIGADGSLTGYGGGLDRKVLLLEHEARVAGRPTGRFVAPAADRQPTLL